jgi:hypothetical protein
MHRSARRLRYIRLDQNLLGSASISGRATDIARETYESQTVVRLTNLAMAVLRDIARALKTFLGLSSEGRICLPVSTRPLKTLLGVSAEARICLPVSTRARNALLGVSSRAIICLPVSTRARKALLGVCSKARICLPVSTRARRRQAS